MIEGNRQKSARHTGRYRDLVDLVIMLTTDTRIRAVDLRRALVQELRSRQLPATGPVGLPSPEWTPGYESLASSLAAVPFKRASDAVAYVQAAIDPVLANTASGTWDPRTRSWHD